MASYLERLTKVLYEGNPVPPMEGGHLFHTVCEECRRRGDLFWTESRIHDLARELGYWPWSVSQIEAALRRSIDLPGSEVAEEPDHQAETGGRADRKAARVLVTQSVSEGCDPQGG